MTEFTPVYSPLGGTLIGLAAVALMAVHGRIAGISGMVGGLLKSPTSADWGWRVAFLAGMIASPVVLLIATGSMPNISVPPTTAMLIGGGVLVGIGVTFGYGGTSGHGVCGISRFSARSITATMTFMVTGLITVFLIRHVIGG